MRRKARIKLIVEAIDNKVYDPYVRNDQLLKDALYSYRDSLVQEFYEASNPKPKKEPQP